MRRYLLLIAVAVCALAAAACRDQGGSSTTGSLTERWLRIGEEADADVVVFDGALPPNLPELLNPGAAPGDTNRVSLPVHPDGKLRGSYVVARGTGVTLVWLVYDVAKEPGEVAGAIADQLNQSPWQVTGGQADGTGRLVRFQSTRGEDLQGTGIVIQRVTEQNYRLVVKRDGKEQTLTVRRGSARPNLGADLSDNLAVNRVEPGAARTAGLREGDQIVKINDTAVSDRKSLANALQTVAGTGKVESTLTYLLQVNSTPVKAIGFAPPASYAVPGDFPLKGLFDSLIVLEYQWVKEPGSAGYTATGLTRDSTGTLLQKTRDALQKDGWRVTGDQASGAATMLAFEHADGRAGQAAVDVFEDDSAYARLVVQVQGGGGRGN